MIPRTGDRRRHPIRTAESADQIDPPLASVWSDRNRADARCALIRRCLLWACIAAIVALWAWAAVYAAGAGLTERMPI
ncbi:hypothetical protein ACVDG3_08760 [Meridianimarinicoccus sp. RP-17]|uniref:hypothetical protein n=1 Tax=Meridianimarinicoccus zhengii TaxID=2056810 RepID=UPI000DAC7BF6|nr:hypothetical protein [Phycocomes zhengii]